MSMDSDFPLSPLHYTKKQDPVEKLEISDKKSARHRKLEKSSKLDASAHKITHSVRPSLKREMVEKHPFHDTTTSSQDSPTYKRRYSKSQKPPIHADVQDVQVKNLRRSSPSVHLDAIESSDEIISSEEEDIKERSPHSFMKRTDSTSTTSSEPKLSTSGESSSLQSPPLDTETEVTAKPARMHHRATSAPATPKPSRLRSQPSFKRSLTSPEQREALSQQVDWTKELTGIHQTLEKSTKAVIEAMLTSNLPQEKLLPLLQVFDQAHLELEHFTQQYLRLHPEFKSPEITKKLEAENNLVAKIAGDEINKLAQKIQEASMQLQKIFNYFENHMMNTAERVLSLPMVEKKLEALENTLEALKQQNNAKEIKRLEEKIKPLVELKNLLMEAKESLPLYLHLEKRTSTLDKVISHLKIENEKIHPQQDGVKQGLAKLNSYRQLLFNKSTQLEFLQLVQKHKEDTKALDTSYQELKANEPASFIDNLNSTLDLISDFTIDLSKKIASDADIFKSNQEYTGLKSELSLLDQDLKIRQKQIRMIKMVKQNHKKDADVLKTEMHKLRLKPEFQNLSDKSYQNLEDLLNDLTFQDTRQKEEVKVIQSKMKAIEEEFAQTEINKILKKKLSKKEFELYQKELNLIHSLNEMAEFNAQLYVEAFVNAGIGNEQTHQTLTSDILKTPMARIFDYVKPQDMYDTALKRMLAKFNEIQQG